MNTITVKCTADGLDAATFYRRHDGVGCRIAYRTYEPDDGGTGSGVIPFAALPGFLAMLRQSPLSRKSNLLALDTSGGRELRCEFIWNANLCEGYFMLIAKNDDREARPTTELRIEMEEAEVASVIAYLQALLVNLPGTPQEVPTFGL